jgi:TrmH family RNA methyltransferase
MVAKEITSLQHSLVRRAADLRLKRKSREREMRVLIAGCKLIRDLAACRPIEIIFFHGPVPEVAAFEFVPVTEAVLKKITGLENPDGWAAIVHLPPAQSLQKMDAILIFDQISDPGNLGTLWRTALGLGWQGIWLTPGSVDPFNDKALRAAQGATFRLPYEYILPRQIIEWSQNRKASLYTADLSGLSIDECKARTPLALVLGNEGQGPGDWTQSISHRITIPTTGSIESLNVACAGAILLYAMRPGR